MSKFRVVLLGLLVACAASAFAASSASALRWFICQRQTTNTFLFEESLCFTHKVNPKNGAFELEELKGLLLVNYKLVENAVLKSEVLATQVEISCSLVDARLSSILNPVSGNGDDNGTTLFLNCIPVKPSGCTIKEKDITSPALSRLITVVGLNWDLFEPETSGGPFATFSFENCTLGTFDKKYEVKGIASGAWDNETSETLFDQNETQELLEHLKFNGEPATFKARVLVLTDGGGGVQVL